MKNQWKTTLLVLFVLITTIAAVTWKTQSLLLDDKIGFITDASSKQAAPLKHLVQERVTEEKEKLVRFAAGRAASQAGRVQNFSGFDVVALVQPTEGGQWSPSWIEKGPSLSTGEHWPSGFEVTLLRSLPYSKLKSGETHWARVSDTQGAPVYAVMVPVEIMKGANSGADSSAESAPAAPLPDNAEYASGAATANINGKRAVVVGFTTVNPLASVTEDYIGSSSDVFLVDDRGYVASHVNKAFVGALFSEDPLVQDIMKSQKAVASGQFEDLNSQPIIGHYERIGKTNLYAVITTPLTAATGIVALSTRVIIATGFGVGIFALIVAWFVGRSMRARVSFADQGRAVSVDEQTPREVGAPAAVMALNGNGWADRLADERRAAFEAFNEGFSMVVKDPLMAILGHAQLAKTKADGNKEVVDHASSIEREARRAKEVVERLQAFGVAPIRDEDEEDDLIEMNSAIDAAIGRVQNEFENEGIKIEKDFEAVPRIEGSLKELAQMIVHVLENSREALKSRPEKTVRLRLRFVNDRVVFSVGDTGIGMSRDVKERAFEPFFKGFDSIKRMGLGLAFVQASVKRHYGDFTIDSNIGEGTNVKFSFPVGSEEKRQFQAAAVRKLTEEMNLAPATSTPPTTPSEVAPILGGKLALNFEESEKLPPVKKDDFDDDEEVDLISFGTGLIATPITTLSFGAASSTDDDDDDQFANMSLGDAIASAQSEPKVEEKEVEASGGFAVRIRRPKAKTVTKSNPS